MSFCINGWTWFVVRKQYVSPCKYGCDQQGIFISLLTTSCDQVIFKISIDTAIASLPVARSHFYYTEVGMFKSSSSEWQI